MGLICGEERLGGRSGDGRCAYPHKDDRKIVRGRCNYSINHARYRSSLHLFSTQFSWVNMNQNELFQYGFKTD